MKKSVSIYPRTALLFFAFFFFLRSDSIAQCSVTSSNGWVATFSVTPTAVIPSTTNCQWSYNYDIKFNLKVTFTGSTSGRSVSGNLYFTCSGGSGGTPYRSLGTFTSNYTGSVQTTNNSRGYSAVGSYNYGSNPSCTTVKLSDVNCTSYRIDYWGTGVTNGSFNCAPSTPLPIELLYFDANYSDQKVNFRWATASEKNNDFFTIERSMNGVDYEPVIYVKGAGNSSSTLHYTASDIDPPAGTAYYRLKQTDYDGTSEYSNVFVAENLVERKSLTLSPNPSKDIISINYPCTNAGISIVNIFDSTGKMVLTEKVDCSNEARPKISIANLHKGIYALTLTDSRLQFLTTKFVKE